MKAYRLFWKRTFDASGVASRTQYWLAVLVNFIVVLLLSAILSLIETLLYRMHIWDLAHSMEAISSVILGLYILAAIIPGITLTVRRLHDHNHSGLLYLISFIPGVGGIIMFVFMCLGTVKLDNRWRMNDIQRGYLTEVAEDPLGDWQYEDFVYHMEYEEKNRGKDHEEDI